MSAMPLPARLFCRGECERSRLSEVCGVNTGDRASVPGRLFDVIDDDNLAGPFERHEFQPELLLHCRKQ